ncbi:MAG: hypothetical protein IH608_09760 [Proteobacteria bacterium]|nr:hypothetical protein [Pseudomonadota bacterium]
MTEPDARFEQIFADLVMPEPETAPAEACVANLPLEAERRLREALALFAEGHYARSAEVLRDAAVLGERDPRAAALAAAHLAFATGRLQPGIQRCLGLLETRQHLPDLYAVLGVLLLKSKQRSQAYDAFRSGLGLAPAHPGLQSRLGEMGARRPPILPFLPRAHRANRWLGRVRAWLAGRRDLPMTP